MGKYVLQIPAEDGCVYIYDVETHTLRKLCDITQSDTVPENVRDTLLKAGLPVRLKGEKEC
jgi:hypothetical protein